MGPGLQKNLTPENVNSFLTSENANGAQRLSFFG